MILNFDDYKNRRLEDDGEDYLFEALSVSKDVMFETEKIVDYIQTHLGDMKVVDHKDFDECSGDVMIFKKETVIDVFGCKCLINTMFFNLTGKLDEKVYTVGMNMSMGTEILTDGDVSRVRLQMNGKLILVDGKLTDPSISLISHELRHGYISTKIYDGVPKITAKERITAGKKWNDIYSATVTYIKFYNNNYPFSSFIDGKEFYEILFAIYRSDVGEIAAFTQQAYEDCRKCSGVSSIKAKMKTTELYKMKESFKNIGNILTDENVRKKYEDMKKKYGLINLPTFDRLLKHIEKRNKKVYTNYGKVIAYINEEQTEREGELIEVR